MRHRDQAKGLRHTQLTAFAGALLGLFVCTATFAAFQDEPGGGQGLKVMAWNIWHGGRENGERSGPAQVARLIRDSDADIVALQETYGSGEALADATGFHLHARGTNVSILSRYPLVEDISVFDEFKCVGGVFELPDKEKFALFSIWLPYDTEIWEAGTRNPQDRAAMLAACESSARDLETLLKEIDAVLEKRGHQDLPVILAGDFNSMSHLDYTSAHSDQYDTAIDWPTSIVAMKAGFRDSYREANPVVQRLADRTWSPRFAEQEQDRIDFIYYRGRNMHVATSSIIDKDPEGVFPSDHAAVVTTFARDAEKSGEHEGLKPDEIAIGSYNIRHGNGNDQKLDLKRTGEVIASMDCDIVGLQEVDFRAERSGNVNQIASLGRQLHMYGDFSKFMDFQGGEYGIAVLSRLPVQDSWSIPLPEGGEPRSAAAMRFLTRDHRPVTAIALHFDWVEDDNARFAQARALVSAIGEIAGPVLLIGDFNDTPESRTMALFREIGLICDESSATWPSVNPDKRIDYIVAIPKHRWEVVDSKVIPETMASDHRPIRSVVRLRPDR